MIKPYASGPGVNTTNVDCQIFSGSMARKGNIARNMPGQKVLLCKQVLK